MGAIDALKVLYKHWLLIAVCLIVPVLFAWGISSAATPLYTSSATSFVSVPGRTYRSMVSS